MSLKIHHPIQPNIVEDLDLKQIYRMKYSALLDKSQEGFVYFTEMNLTDSSQLLDKPVSESMSDSL